MVDKVEDDQLDVDDNDDVKIDTTTLNVDNEEDGLVTDSGTVGEGDDIVDDIVDEVVVTIGEEAPPPDEESSAPEWVRELRKNHRESQRRVRELEDKLKATTTATETNPVLSKKPVLDDFDYDTAKYEQALTSWYDQKRVADEAAAAREAEVQAQKTAWEAKLTSYGEAKTGLKVKDFDDAEEVIQDVFSTTQQGIIIQGSDNPALVVYALGKNSKKAKELSSITDPVKFAFAVAKLETQLKVSNRKAPPAPEKTVGGTGSKSGTVDSTLERLRAEAAKTGNMTKVIAYKRQKRKAS